MYERGVNGSIVRIRIATLCAFHNKKQPHNFGIQGSRIKGIGYDKNCCARDPSSWWRLTDRCVAAARAPANEHQAGANAHQRAVRARRRAWRQLLH